MCGLSLESLQRRLRAHGHQVSLAGLDYWLRTRRVVRARTDGADRMVVLMLLDLAEFEVGVSGLAQRVTRLDAAFRQPTANCLIQVRFDPGALPIRCYPLWQPLTGQPAQLDDEVRAEPTGSTHLALADLPAGRCGLV